MKNSLATGDHSDLPADLWSILETHTKAAPEKIAYRVLSTKLEVQASITYRDLLLKAEAKAARLESRGLSGRPVIFLQPTGIDFITSFFAVLRGGGAVVPINPRLTLKPAEDLAPLAANAGTNIIFCDQASAARIGRAYDGSSPFCFELCDLEEPASSGQDSLPPPAAHASAVAVVQYTSGSTQSPKGVCITHANLLANARILTRTFKADASDVAVSWLPLFHDMGLMTGLVWPAVEGASAVLLKPSVFSARPISWLRCLSDNRGTISAAPNFAYQLCADRIAREEAAQIDLSAWRIAICGAEPVSHQTVDAFLDAFAPSGFKSSSFYPSYGLAEATLFVTGGRHDGPPRSLDLDVESLERDGAVWSASEGARSRRIVACGAPAANLEVRVVDPETKRLLPDRAVGEVWIRGASVSPGYLQDDGSSAGTFGATLQGRVPEGGFLRTGDLGFLERGDLFVVGRMKDLIIVRGAKHVPHDIELTCARAHAALGEGRGVAFAVGNGTEDGVVVLHEISQRIDDQPVNIIETLRSAVAHNHGLTLHAVSLLPPRTLQLTSSGKVRRAPTRLAWLAGDLPVIATWRAELAPGDMHVGVAS